MSNIDNVPFLTVGLYLSGVILWGGVGLGGRFLEAPPKNWVFSKTPPTQGFRAPP